MKQTATIFALMLICILALTGITQAQVNYTMSSITGENYTRLAGASAFTWTTTTANDEEYSAATNIGFNFTYCGTVFTQLQASTNGFIKLGSGLTGARPSDSLSGFQVRGIVAPLWDNLKVTATATDITYLLEGVSGSQTLTIEWQNVYWNNTAAAPNANFQIVLYEGTNLIKFKYGFMGTPTLGSASIGLVDNTVLTIAGPSTGKYLSLNVGGSPGSRTYHQSMGYTFNGINAAPDSGTTLTFTPVTASALAGTYDVGTGLDYNTLSEAAMALNINGISGAVIMRVADGTYDDIFHLIDVVGTSSSNTITLKLANGASVTMSPSNGSQSTSSPGSAAGDAIIRLDGTDYVTVNGLSLTQNANNTTAAKKFNMGISVNNSVLNTVPQSGAQHNTFKNLSIDLGGTGGLTGGLIGIRLGTTGTTTGAFSQTNSFNTIQDVTITGFHVDGIKMFGHSNANPDSGNTITAVTGRNTIGTVTGGIGLDQRIIELDCQSTITIEKTDITSVSNTINVTNNIYGIVTNLAGSASQLNRGVFTIRNNTISGFSNGGASVTTGFAGGMSFGACNNTTVYEIYNNKIYNLFTNGNALSRATGILINGSTTTNLLSKVYNNMISDIRAPGATSAPGVRGLDMQNAGGSGTMIVYHNSVHLDNSVPPSVTGTNVAHTSTCLYFASMTVGTGTNLDVRDNIFVNEMGNSSTGTGVSRACAILTSLTANFIKLATTTDYNLYYAGTPSLTRPISYCFVSGSDGYQTVTEHIDSLAAAAGGGSRDVHSKSVAVAFVSSSDLHLDAAALPNYSLTGSPLSSPYDVDIDGETRNATYPYIGADENLATVNPVELTSFTAVARGKNVELQWKTATETNNMGFDVEKSLNGVWSKIGFVNGAGNSNAPKEYGYVDAVNENATYSYRLKQIDRDGKFNYIPAIEVHVNGAVNSYQLDQNFPNPFNPTTTIRFSVPQLENASIKVYDVTGREVATLFNEAAAPGQVYNIQFNGAGLASGIYFYVLQTQNHRDVKKMQLLK